MTRLPYEARTVFLSCLGLLMVQVIAARVSRTKAYREDFYARRIAPWLILYEGPKQNVNTQVSYSPWMNVAQGDQPIVAVMPFPI